MVMAGDLEKASPVNGAESSSAASSTASSPVLEPIRTVETRRSRPRDPDVFEPLEHALTPDVETQAEREAREPITYTRTGTSVTSNASRPADFEVFFQDGDPDNPRNWSKAYRSWIIVCVSYSTWVVVLYSTCYTASVSGLAEEFGVTSTVTTLGLTTYLLGLAVGSLIVAPLSELYGRQKVYILCLTAWALLILPCALATSVTEIIVVRFFG